MNERLDNISEKLLQSLEEYMEDTESADTAEVGAVADIIKDLATAKEKEAKANYYCQIVEAMGENEYGLDYDEAGPKLRKGYEEMRDMDHGKMYYTTFDEAYTRGYTEGQAAGESKYSKARKEYEESKKGTGTDQERQKRMEKMQHLMDIIDADLSAYLPEADNNEKITVRNGLQKIITKFA